MNNILPYLIKITKEAWLCTLAALLILALFQPFGLEQINKYRWLYIICEALIAFVVYSLTQMTLYLFPAYRTFIPQNAWQFIQKTLIHYILFIPTLSFAILSFNYWYCGAPISAAWHTADGSFSLYEIAQMCLWVLIIGVFICVWQLYRFRNYQLSQDLQDIKAINALLEARQQQLADQHMGAAENPQPQKQVLIQGNAQNAQLMLCPDDIIYIESMANYADIAYICGDSTRHTTLRITLKQLREQLAEADYLVQCHRAFLVNLNFVRNLSVRSAGSYELELFGLDKKVPVSRANADKMRKNLEK